MTCNVTGCLRRRKAPTSTGVHFGTCDAHLTLQAPSGAQDTSAQDNRVMPARRWAPRVPLAGLLAG